MISQTLIHLRQTALTQPTEFGPAGFQPSHRSGCVPLRLCAAAPLRSLFDCKTDYLLRRVRHDLEQRKASLGRAADMVDSGLVPFRHVPVVAVRAVSNRLTLSFSPRRNDRGLSLVQQLESAFVNSVLGGV